MVNLNCAKMTKIYIAVLLYSSVFRIILGRWGSIIADFATVFVVLYVALVAYKGRLYINRVAKVVLVLTIALQTVAIFELFNSNINNFLYAVIEYRKSYFQVIAFIMAYWLFMAANIKFDDIVNYIGVVSIPIIVYGIKQYFWWGNLDSKIVGMTDSNMYTLYYGGHMRSMSIFSGPFHFGMFCVIIFALFFYLWRKKRQNMYVLYLVICAIGCYCSITRTNLVCLLAVLAIWYLMYWMHKFGESVRLNKVVSLGIFGIVGFVVIIVTMAMTTSNSIIVKLVNSLLDLSGDTRFMSRFSTWGQALEYICQNPLVGFGIGSAADTMSEYGVSTIYVTSHSMYLKMFMELGVIGGLIYLALFLVVIIEVKKDKDYMNRTLIYSLTAVILLNGLVGSTIPAFPGMTLYWCIMGMYLSKEQVKFFR